MATSNQAWRVTLNRTGVVLDDDPEVDCVVTIPRSGLDPMQLRAITDQLRAGEIVRLTAGTKTLLSSVLDRLNDELFAPAEVA